jgi:hypothetical protein
LLTGPFAHGSLERNIAMQVRIITCCPDEAALYANLLIFRSLRIGFPTACVIVTDNGSRPWARLRIMETVQSCGAEMRVAGPMSHGDLIAKLLSDLPDGEAAAVVDPDIWFWENVENWRFPETTLLAGRLIPTHRCDVEQSVIHRRLHSSFLWMPDQRRLRLALPAVTEAATWRRFEWNVGGEKHLWDTGTRLYADLEPESVQAFDEAHLDCYEHLFGGTDAASVLPRIHEDFRPLFEKLHEAARQQDLPGSLRGAWRIQDRYFSARSV